MMVEKMVVYLADQLAVWWVAVWVENLVVLMAASLVVTKVVLMAA